MDALRTAIVGLGKMGLVHACILSTMSNVEVVALCDKTYLILRLTKKLFKNAVVVNDVDRLADLDLDAVYVTTPIPSHYPIVKNLYSKKITPNLFVEKTLSSNWDKAKEMSNLAENSGGVNMVGYMKRFAVTFGKARQLLEQGVLGELDSFTAHAFSADFFGFSNDSKPNNRGGVLSDLGSHVIDLAFWFFGDFRVESAVLASEGTNKKDTCKFTVRKKDLVGNFAISWCMENYRMPDFELTIKGTKGALKVNDGALELKLNDGKIMTWYRHDLGDNVAFLLGESEYYREDNNFVQAVLTGKNAEPSFVTASRVEYIIDEVKKKAGLFE